MSDDNFPGLTKTCAICGKAKPLSSFLQMTSREGSLYGTICSVCRKAEAEKAKLAEGDTRRDTGRTIDARTRVKSEADKKEQLEKARDADIEESKTDTLDKTKIIDKKDIKAKEERKHHNSFLSGRSFLGQTKTEKTKVDIAAKAIEIEDQHIQYTSETIKQTESSKEERQIKGIDTTVAYQGSQTGFQEKHRRLVELTSWMGDTPMLRNIKRAMAEKTGKNTENTPTPTDEPSGPKSRGRG
jgi:hypothetical protein